MEEFIRKIRDTRINPAEPDKSIRKASKEGIYTVKSSMNFTEGGSVGVFSP